VIVDQGYMCIPTARSEKYLPLRERFTTQRAANPGETGARKLTWPHSVAINADTFTRAS
jgi:hypothetical protein